MPSTKDIAWLAGLLEGEGCFMWAPFTHRQHGKEYQYHRPVIQVNMTDPDVIERVASLFKTKAYAHNYDKRPNRKPCTRAVVVGKRAIGWMQTLYPLLGQRRQAKVRSILQQWKEVSRA